MVDPIQPNSNKKQSLLKRTWSSRRKKASHAILEDDSNNIAPALCQVEEGLADVVDEINATIGLMSQYTTMYLHQHKFYESDVENKITQLENLSEPIQQQQEVECNEDFAANWEIFDNNEFESVRLSFSNADNSSSPQASDFKIDSTTFIQSLEENAMNLKETTENQTLDRLSDDTETINVSYKLQLHA
jgi:hypothetical protein